MKVDHKTFSGGYLFENFEGNPTSKISNINMPQTITIPLKQGLGCEIEVVVKKGDKVKAGEIIGKNNEFDASPVHSCVNGVVEDIIKLDGEVNAVVIKPTATSEWEHSSDWTKKSAAQIQEHLYLSGVTSLDREGIPTTHKSSIISPDEVEDVIIKAIRDEMFNLSLGVLLEGEKFQNFVEGLRILKKTMPNSKFHLVLGDNENDLVDGLVKELTDISWLKLYTVAPKYPIHIEEVLIPTILGKQYPVGYLAANIGVVTLSVQTVLHAYDAVILEKPVIERTIALCGPVWKENIHLRVPIGTNVLELVKEYIKEDVEYRLVVNSLLTNEVSDPKTLYIDKDTNLLIAIPEDRNREKFSFIRPGTNRDSFSNSFLSSLTKKVQKLCDTNTHGEYRPCVTCGFCEEACPVGLTPHMIYKHIDRKLFDERLIDLGVHYCMRCNLCSYVCLSKVNVGEFIKEGQDAMNEQGFNQKNYISPKINLIGSKE